MQLTDKEAQFILSVGREGKPAANIAAADISMAGDLLKRGAMFDWWKGLEVSRLTPTATAFDAATALAAE